MTDGGGHVMGKRIKLRSGYTITTTHGLYDPADGSFGTGGASASRPQAHPAWSASIANAWHHVHTVQPFDSEDAAIKAARKWIKEQ